MSTDEQINFLKNKYNTDNVIFLGSGSDSRAYLLNGEYVCRFSPRNVEAYIRESEICRFIKPFISCQIPDIEIVYDKDCVFAKHKIISGKKWSWHSFQFLPWKQKCLAESCAKFLAQLHSVNVNDLVQQVPDLTNTMPYIDFDDVEQNFKCFLTDKQIAMFRKHYEQIVQTPVADSDMVCVHMGLKGPNSVVYPNGTLLGVFDFGNCGIYERWRDLVLFSLSRNKTLYNSVLSWYEKYSGKSANKKRIADLLAIEFLWRKRWYINGVFRERHGRFIMRNIATAMTHFYKLPKCFELLFYIRILLHNKFYKH